MTVEELKNYLSSIYELDHEIDRMHNQVCALESEAAYISARYGGEAVKHTRNVHATEDIIVRKIDLEQRMNEATDRLVDMRANALLSFTHLSHPEYTTVMKQRYLDYLPWEKIAENNYCSISTAKRWHVLALEEMVALKNEPQ